jgi:hypothetical protein
MGKSITDLSSVTTVGLDLAKHVFQVHGVDASGRVVVAKAIRRNKPLEFFASLAPCLVELEASGSAHHWARELITLGHEARMMPPAYVKPYIRRQKNDASDASAICEAVTRPSMRFVGVRSLMNQAALMRHKAREMLVTQRTQLRSRSATGSFMARRATAPAADVMGRMPAAARGPALKAVGCGAMAAPRGSRRRSRTAWRSPSNIRASCRRRAGLRFRRGTCSGGGIRLGRRPCQQAMKAP